MKIFFTQLFIAFTLMISAQVEQATLLGQWNDPSLVGSASFDNAYNEVWGLAVNNREFAVIGTTAGTHFIDVTDPNNPELVQFVAGAVQGPVIIHRDYHDDGCFLFVVADEPASVNSDEMSTLQVIDISRLPESVEVVYDSDELIFRAHNIFIDEPNDRLYALITNGAGLGFSAMRIYDISVPDDPQFVALHNSLEGINIQQVHDGFIEDNMAYLNLGPDGFAIVDFTDPVSPTLLGTLDNYPQQGYNHSGWLSQDGQYYYMSDETHGLEMKVLDVSDPTDIEVTDFFSADNPAPSSIPHNQVVACDYLYVSYYYDGLQVYDISDPATPIRIAEFDTSNEPDACSFKGAWGVYPFLPSGNILVSDMQEGLFVFEAIDESECSQRRDMCRGVLINTSETIRNDLFSIQPNPANEYINILATESISNEVNVTLSDITGRAIMKEKRLIHSGENLVNLPIDLSAGLYLLSINGEDFLYTEKLVIE